MSIENQYCDDYGPSSHFTQTTAAWQSEEEGGRWSSYGEVWRRMMNAKVRAGALLPELENLANFGPPAATPEDAAENLAELAWQVGNMVEISNIVDKR